MTNAAPRPPLAACFGGGGAFGYGFNMGVADGLKAEGIDLAHVPMVGTSAGSHAAATIDTALAFDDVATIWQTYIDGSSRYRLARGIDLSEPIYGGRDATDLGAVAVRLLTLRRRVLSAEEYPLADIVAASSSVLPIVRPHRIDGKRYVDGGTISLASIDLSPNADLLLAVTPYAVKGLGIAGRLGAFQAKREIRTWTERHGGSVLHVVPSDEMAALGSSRIRDIGDMRIGRAVYPSAVELGRNVAAAIRRHHPTVAARLTDHE